MHCGHQHHLTIANLEQPAQENCIYNTILLVTSGTFVKNLKGAIQFNQHESIVHLGTDSRYSNLFEQGFLDLMMHRRLV